MKRLRCVQCGIEASPSSSWLWYSKEFDLHPSGRGPKGRQRLWLCPDCAADIGDETECDAFLARIVAGGPDE